MINIFATLLLPLEQELSADSFYSVSKPRSIGHNSNYTDHVEAMNFVPDDGDDARTHYHDKADPILVGVSRYDKTPTCLYVALQCGTRTTNYPLTEEDMERLQLPNALKQYKHKLFGLIIDPDRFIAIRSERKPNSRYADLVQYEFEVREVKSLLRHENIAYISSTHSSVGGIPAKTFVEKDVEWRFK